MSNYKQRVQYLWQRPKPVVVVGAGLSGMTAASYLTQAGVPVKLFEALDRVGGRTYTEQDKLGPVDHGAGYIGSTQTAVEALLEELNVKTHKVPGPDLLYTLSWGGKVYYMENVLQELLHDRLEWQESAAITQAIGDIYQKGEIIRSESGDPWNSKNSEILEWDKMTVQNWIDSMFPRIGNKFDNARTIFQFICRIPLGVEAHETSFLYFLWYFRNGSGLVQLLFPAQDKIVVGGTQQLSEKMNAQLPKRSQAQLNTPVLSINNDDSSKVVITPADGYPIEAERCILAMTPHTRDYIAFRPLLSPMYHKLPQRTPMGTTIKIHLFYNEKFWRVGKKLNGNATIFDGDSISQTYDCTAPGETPCLQAFYVGEVGRRMAMMDPAAREKDAKATIGKIFGNPEKANANIGYSEFIWENHPWIGGAPTGTCAPGTLTCYGNAVRTPTGRIHFASTETAQDWTGYMDGAIRAGHRAASEVLKELGKPEPKPLPPVPNVINDDLKMLNDMVNATNEKVNDSARETKNNQVRVCSYSPGLRITTINSPGSNPTIRISSSFQRPSDMEQAQQFLTQRFGNLSVGLEKFFSANKRKDKGLIAGLNKLQESIAAIGLQ
uniref:Amine oxidase n=1 Tax=Amphimedon queenslandica TaxID=400682 RepID=A0A1X7UK52_AMPQE